MEAKIKDQPPHLALVRLRARVESEQFVTGRSGDDGERRKRGERDGRGNRAIWKVIFCLWSLVSD